MVVVVVGDAVALVVFVAVGVATHGASAGAFGRDVACILGGWFAAALALRLYGRGGWNGRGGWRRLGQGGWRRLVATWLLGITAGVAVRAAVVGHFAADFYAVALAFTALFVLVARLVTARLR